MKAAPRFLNRVVAALLSLLLVLSPAWAEDQSKLDDLFRRLQTADAEEAGRIESEIWIEWSKSGSPTLDLLLQRGSDAMANGEPQVAIEHFTAIIDHDPQFTEAWNARATAYYSAGEIGPSMADIAHVLNANPRHFGALTGLGMILEETGDETRALKAYRAAKAIHPHLEAVNEAIDRLEKKLEGQDL
ncbi:tetratricopeptide repeat protein [Rhodobacter sp. Har01]|uniref:tetratricopeptide repeat protein n=1 Tax=Rhodobacter sp. Har01 TaxID=2883999 RepID=UPI001D064709|nr:tetratricopeptide repeat protein [Rhodobacter sp. Har01]MCB6178726.1 tetratricopeptide repeat protein [Rhodobacter sp. Har01]